MGLASFNAISKPLISKRVKETRLNWCLEKRNWTFSKWSNVIFSDESNFRLVNRKLIPKVRRFSHEKYLSMFIKPIIQCGGGSVGIWGCIAMNGAGCCQTWFATNHVPVMNWPPRSPDLSPIEHIWIILDRKLQNIHLNNLSELDDNLAKAWNAIEPSLCAKSYRIDANKDRRLYKTQRGLL